MVKLIILFLLPILYNFHTAVCSNPDALNFIKSECRATRYPALCVQCLANYSTTIQQNQRQLAQSALSVSISWAQSAATFVSRLARMKGMKPAEYRAVKDCIENMGDTVDQLGRSMKELGAMGRIAGQDFNWHVSNVQTWVSAAMTNENTCVEGFAGAEMDGSVKVAIRRRVLNCAQVTSNALALVNRFAARHKVRHP